MVTTTKKLGRPVASYRTSWGEVIQGLNRRKDGVRWKISATGQTFNEPDERLAVAKFIKLTRPADAEVALTDPVPPEQLAAMAAKIKDEPIGAVNENGMIKLQRTIPEPLLWAWFREQIITRPKHVALMCGIEQLGYLSDIGPPKPSAKLDDVGKLYVAKPGLSANEATRSAHFWKEFRKAVKVETIRELDHAAMIAYEKAIQGMSLAPKSVKHRYSKIRTIISYAMERGESPADCRKALDASKMLKVKGATALDPHPIEPDDFWKVYKAAEDDGNNSFAAAMLVALNACMYGSEISALEWKEVNLKKGELVTSRPKTGVSRVAVLWPETIKALKAVPIDPVRDETIFNARARYTSNGVNKLFARYRKAAGFGEEVTFGMIRDASYTIACQTVSLDKARVLAGHRLPGATDHYVKRNPGFVREACEAVRQHFFGAGVKR